MPINNNQTKPITIWVIDDDPICCFIAEKMIGMALNIDCELKLFNNGQSALDALLDPEIKDPELILLDINMPIMDGFEFLEELKSLDTPLDLQIAIISSSTDIQDEIRAEKYPEVFQFITKPLSPESIQFLVDKIQKL